ncbi:MAG TPA: SLBB domain-containing protein [Pyrinomonadaceae bacterium]|nr:SLBB domain-containing protein [Pyrinomonadaceae bacterium]
MKIRFLLLLSTLGIFAFSGFSQTPTLKTPMGYLIGPGDVLSIKALGEKDFEVEAITVDEDGKILLPWVNDPVVASCKTERELQADVVKLWSQYLKNPQVNVRVSDRKSRPPVSVTGEVAKQAQFDLTRRTSLLEVLSAAGGWSDKSSGMVQIIRTRPPLCSGPEAVEEWKKETGGLGVSTRLYSLAAVAQGSSESNPEILPGDIINVPQAAPVYVTGEVKTAGPVYLPASGLPLSQAIAMANGNTDAAKTKSIKIYRRKQGATEREVIVANLNGIKTGQEKEVMLQPYDIVEVGKAGETFGSFMMKLLTGLPNRVPIPIP